VPPRSPARRRHLQPVPQAHPLLAGLFPPLTKAEVEVAAERVRHHGQQFPIETINGAIVAGWEEYLACVEAEIVPSYTQIEVPDDLLSYVIRTNVPRHLSKLDRACVAVLGREHYQAEARERAREGNRRGGLAKGEKSRDQGSRDQIFDGERWWEAAARVVGTTPGAVRRLAQIHAKAPDVFDAVRARRIEVLRDARDLMLGLVQPEARAQALVLRDEDRRAPIARIIAEVSRSRRPELPATRRTRTAGKTWTLYTGHMDVEGDKIPEESIDAVHADAVYGDVAMAADIGRLAYRVLAPGGVLALIAGVYNPLSIQTAVAQQGLVPLTIGSLYLRGVSCARPGRNDRVERVDSLPVYIFAKGTRLARPITHLGFVSEVKAKEHHRWEKNVEATQDILRSLVEPGARVLDPCMGSGTTGEAAMRHACTFVGIDTDPNAVRVAAARLAGVERELAQG
jgi:hypothetical protein